MADLRPMKPCGIRGGIVPESLLKIQKKVILMRFALSNPHPHFDGPETPGARWDDALEAEILLSPSLLFDPTTEEIHPPKIGGGIPHTNIRHSVRLRPEAIPDSRDITNTNNGAAPEQSR